MDDQAGGAPRSTVLARGLGALGRLLITTGVVLLLLVAYQIWGTNLQTNRSQEQLKDQFEQALADDNGVVGAGPSTSTTASTTTTTAPGGPSATLPAEPVKAIPPPAIGDVVGRITIPEMGASNYYVVEGTDIAELKRGPAHYPYTPLPGQAGNAAIAGHRTTYGAPFHNIDKLENGDLIIVETRQGTFRYQVISKTIVGPRDVSVLDDKGDNRLTLTACHPKLSSKQRIIIAATLMGKPAPQIKGQGASAAAASAAHSGGKDATAIDAFESESVLTFPGAWWGLLVVALWLVVRLLAWRGHATKRFPRWLPYLVGTPICLVVLYVFFESVSFEAFTRVVNL